MNQKLDELKSITRLKKDLKRIEECGAAGSEYLVRVEAFRREGFEREEWNKKRRVAADKVLAAAQRTAAAGMDQTANGAYSALATLKTRAWAMAIGLGIGAVIGVFLSISITRTTNKPINKVISGLAAGAEQVESAASHVPQSSQSIAKGASEQAFSLEESSASLEETSSVTRHNAGGATQANNTATDAGDAAERGREAMKRMAEVIGDVKESSEETAKILKTIDEIAF